MSNGDTLRWNLLNWPTLLLFVLVSWGIVLLPPTLRSTRPTGEVDRVTGRAEGQLFESRLWQDPFDVLPAARQIQERLPCPEQALLAAKDRPGRKLILPVFLPGNEYPEDVETRLRSRYAVVSALGISGYIPESAGDILCCSSLWPAGSSSSQKRVVFPYEWYRLVPPGEDLTRLTRIPNACKAPKYIAVVWVDENLFDEGRVGQDPATLLDQWARCLPKGQKVELAVLGPQTSTTLKAMLEKQRQHNRAGCAGDRTEKNRIYSFSSTVAALRDKSNENSLLSDRFEVIHVIGTDRDLACAIRKELVRRGVSLASRGSSIALVAEWDTYYSQSMFNAFGKEFQSIANDPDLKRAEEDRLRFFTYQQGIDGRLPKDRSPDTKGADKPTGGILPGGEPLVTAPEVRAFGRSQVDYLQRLVDQMKRTGHRWKAIGVLGSDFYDKVLLIKALKHEFPGALFFTTDLDARYLDTVEHRTTRNLLVASHFGLELHEGLQRAIPPFRSVYQTALFFGCLKALHAEGVPLPRIPEEKNAPPDPLRLQWATNEKDAGPTPKPMVFEIGRTRAYPLTAPDPEELHPTSYQRQRALGLGCAGVIGLVVLLTTGVLLWAMLWPLTGFRLGFAVGTAGAVVLLLAIAAIDDHDPGGEPFSALEGISNWPTVLLRLAAVVFCAFAMFRAREADNKNAAELAERFKLETAGSEGGSVRKAVCLAPNPPPPPAPAPASNPVPLAQTFQRAYHWARENSIRAYHWARENSIRAYHWARENSIGTLSAPGEKDVDPKEVWKEYRRLGRADHRAARVVGYVLLYLVFCGGLIGLFGPPNNPYRGRLNLAVNVAVLYTAIAFTVVLLWYVIDATRLCGRLIWLLMDKETLWPEPALQRTAAEIGVDLRLLHSDDRTVREAVKKSLEQHADVTFLGERTAVVLQLAYDAAFVYLLMFLARSPFFDQYEMSWSMILIYTMALAGVFACGVWLRLSARRARRIAEDKVRDRLSNLRLASPADCGAAARALERIAGAIGKVHIGAFSTLAEDPILRTLVLIVGGIGALLSLEPIGQLLR